MAAMAKSSEKLIKAIIWDFGGVFDPKHEALAGFTQAAERLGITPEALYDHMYSGEAWKLARTGKITNQAYLEAVMADIDPKARDVAAFRDQLWAGHRLDERVVALARRLARQYPMALLSNATDELEAILERHQLTQLFQVVINSARVGVAKPEPRIYQLVLEGLRVAPEEALFIDDKPRNIVAAEQLGITTILFTDATQLEQALIEHGLRIDVQDQS